MELLYEILLEIIFDSSISLDKLKKIPPFVKYPLVCLVILFFIGAIISLFIIGIIIFDTNIWLGTAMILFSIALIILSIMKYKQIYELKLKEMKKKERKKKKTEKKA